MGDFVWPFSAHNAQTLAGGWGSGFQLGSEKPQKSQVSLCLLIHNTIAVLCPATSSPLSLEPATSTCPAVNPYAHHQITSLPHLFPIPSLPLQYVYWPTPAHSPPHHLLCFPAAFQPSYSGWIFACSPMYILVRLNYIAPIFMWVLHLSPDLFNWAFTGLH